MHRLIIALAAVAIVAASCGSDSATAPTEAGAAAQTCLAGDADCQDLGAQNEAPPLPDSIELGDPEGPIVISFGGLFYADGESIRLCDSLAESFPPQCGTTIIEIVGSLDMALEQVSESFGNPDDARIMSDQDIWWTDEWVTISGVLEGGKLVIS
jgi:hypothetical protein